MIVAILVFVLVLVFILVAVLVLVLILINRAGRSRHRWRALPRFQLITVVECSLTLSDSSGNCSQTSPVEECDVCEIGSSSRLASRVANDRERRCDQKGWKHPATSRIGGRRRRGIAKEEAEAVAVAVNSSIGQGEGGHKDDDGDGDGDEKVPCGGSKIESLARLLALSAFRCFSRLSVRMFLLFC